MGRLPGGKPLPVPITMPQLAALAFSACLVTVLFLFLPVADWGPAPSVGLAVTIVLIPFVAVRAWHPDSRSAGAHLRAMTLDRLNDRLEARR
jgi:hypothetical protein